VENKKTQSKLSALLAFLFGIVLMLGVYILFESAPNRLRSGSTDETTDTTSGFTKTANIVQTAAVEDVPLRPSVFLGVEVLSVNNIIAEQLSLPGEHGVLVNRVIEDSPAHEAGLQRGDVILSLDKKAVEDIEGFRKLLTTYNPGDNVRITYIRNDKKDSVYAMLAAAPDSIPVVRADSSPDKDWGVSLSNVSSAVRNSLNIPADVSGVAIVSVTPGGAADEAGLKPGDVITGINQTPISSMEDFFSGLSADNDHIALLDVYSQGSVRYVPIDSSGVIGNSDNTPAQTQTLRQRIMAVLTGGMPFTDDDDEEEGPKGGKFAQDDNVQLTADNPAFNRPSTVPGDENTGGNTTSTTGMNRPSSVPPQSGGPTNDTVLFIGLLVLLILYLSYREYTRPVEVKTK
jgi:hypothetical protein